MNIGICGARPSIVIEGIDEIVKILVDKIIVDRHHVQAIASLGFNMNLLRYLKHKGGLFDLHLWGPTHFMIKKWRSEEDKETLQMCMGRARDIFIPKDMITRKESIYHRNKIYSSMCDWVIIVTPEELDGDLADISKMAKNLYIIRSLADAKELKKL